MTKYTQVVGKTGVYFESVLHLKSPKIVIPNMKLHQLSERISDYYRMDKQVRMGVPFENSKYSDRIIGTFHEREREGINDHQDRVIYDFTFYRQAIRHDDINYIQMFVDTQPDMTLFRRGMLLTLEVIEETL